MKDLFKGYGLVVLAVIGLIVLGLGIWGFKVAFAPVKGAGDTVIKNNSVDNRTQAQARFHQMYNDILGMDRNLDVYAQSVKDHPNDRITRITYDGMVMGCVQAVADYNAATQKILSRDWLDASLPQFLGNDPATDCKPSIS